MPFIGTATSSNPHPAIGPTGTTTTTASHIYHASGVTGSSVLSYPHTLSSPKNVHRCGGNIKLGKSQYAPSMNNQDYDEEED
jgi:hypothetical protein